MTHDRDEAFQLADRMVVLLEGAIQQIGEPKEIYFFPENRKVAKAMGETNFISGTVNGHKFQMEDAEITVQNPASIHGDAVLFIPSGTEFTIEKIAGAGIPAFVEFSEWTPNGQRSEIRIGATICMFTNVSEKLVAGEKIFLTFNEILQVMEC